MIEKLHHVGVVVPDLAAGYTFWRDTLGLPLMREAELPEYGVRAALLGCGSCEIELLQPIASDTGVARFLERRGGGLHHVCLESDDVGKDVKRFWGTGVEMIDAKPRKGLAGLVAFIHPRACAGILVELTTPTDRTPPVESPLAVTVVHVIVESVQTATNLYRDMFGLPIRISHPDWSVAQLAVAGVALQLSSAAATSGKPGLSMLRLMTPDVDAVAARLTGQGLAYRQDAVGLVLGPAATGGTPLIIHKPIG
ncbi:MAG: methylmalonyl-CoA epimerase [Candidatus Rokuibacteriota bacterium]